MLEPDEGDPAAMPPLQATSSASANTAGSGGQEGPGFVQPSSYLRLRAHSRPTPPAKPLSRIDREQLESLVSIHRFRTVIQTLPGRAPTRSVIMSRLCADAARLDREQLGRSSKSAQVMMFSR